MPWNEVGEYGGTVRWDEFTVDNDHYFRHLMNVRMVSNDTSETVYFNSGLGGETKPMVLESWTQNDDATEFTLTLRKGLKWSDGTPVTTEDIRFRIEDELLNTELTPNPPAWLRWNPEMSGVTTQFEVVDDYTVKLTFAMPYGAFIPQMLRGTNNTTWLVPSHFYKKYHKTYTPVADMADAMKERGFSSAEEWSNFYQAIWYTILADSGGLVKHPYASTLPTLYPWIVKEIKPDTSLVLERNPYFFAVDTAGNQLPYVDYLNRQFISNSELMNLDIIAGKVDVQGQFLRIDDYPLFVENQDKGNYVVIPVNAYQHHMLIVWLNPAVADEKWSTALSNLEFRRALSIALDREHINEAVFKGLGSPAQFAPPIGSALYDPALTSYAAEYDPEGAKAILEELGYKDSNGDGVREFPDGSDMILPWMFYEVTPAAVPGVQLLQQYWGDIGIKVDAKQLENSTWWQFQGSNDVPGSVWWANGPDFGDGGFIGMRVNTPLWNRWRDTNGKEGVEPPDWVKRIWEIQNARVQVATEKERLALDAEGWKLLVENVGIIGTVEGAKTPLILSQDFGNVEYGFDKEFVGPNYLGNVLQFYYKNPERRNN